jgi:hypothetical protein
MALAVHGRIANEDFRGLRVADPQRACIVTQRLVLMPQDIFDEPAEISDTQESGGVRSCFLYVNTWTATSSRELRDYHQEAQPLSTFGHDCRRWHTFGTPSTRIPSVITLAFFSSGDNTFCA